MTARKKKTATDLVQLAQDVRQRGLAYPETYPESPWGDQVLKVRNKMFMVWYAQPELLTLTFHLPHSGMDALQLPFAEPTGYGLGKAGWVTLRLPPDEDVVVEALYSWLDESYRSVAPKALVKTLPPHGPPPPSTAPPAPLPPVFAKVVLVTDDAFRGERAVTAWRALGVEVVATLTLADTEVPKADAVVIDLGRQWKVGVELARHLRSLKKPPRVALVGIRDAKMEQEVAFLDLPGSRLPPGDPQAATWLAAWLQKKASPYPAA